MICFRAILLLPGFPQGVLQLVRIGIAVLRLRHDLLAGYTGLQHLELGRNCASHSKPRAGCLELLRLATSMAILLPSVLVHRPSADPSFLLLDWALPQARAHPQWEHRKLMRYTVGFGLMRGSPFSKLGIHHRNHRPWRHISIFGVGPLEHIQCYITKPLLSEVRELQSTEPRPIGGLAQPAVVPHHPDCNDVNVTTLVPVQLQLCPQSVQTDHTAAVHLILEIFL
mmetsp:Transcript_122481/g.280734  ORF Transcript_122481/g.280734 Transcript_122481/m.280734 type:complete len:226 (-) Transcript_122481:524-1201(-)